MLNLRNKLFSLVQLFFKDAQMDFSTALFILKDGNKVARSGWNGQGMWIELQRPDKHSKMTFPYIYMKTADDQRVPWLASQTDLLASDWMIVYE